MPDLEAPPAAVAADIDNESDASEGFDHFLEFLQSPPGATAVPPAAARPLNPTGKDIVEGGAKLVGLALGQEKGAEEATESSSPRAGDGKDQLYAGKSKSYMELIKEKQLSKKELKKAEKGKKKGKKKSDVPPATKDQAYGGKSKSYKSLIEEKQQSKKELGSLTNHSSRLPTKQNPSMNSSERSGLSQQSLREAFGKINADGSGQISKTQLRDSLLNSALSISFYGEEIGEIDTLFDAIDADNDGVVDFEDYSSFMQRVLLSNKLSNKKSSLKVATLSDSLRSCGEENQNPRKKKWIRRYSLFSRGRGRSRAENADLLDSMHSQRSTLKACRHLVVDQTVSLGVDSKASGVRFFDVEVRSYEVVAGVHGVSSGAALELGWSYSVQQRSHIDSFEAMRSTQRAKNYAKEKSLTAFDRRRILREFGASKKEIEEAAKHANILRKQRRRSIGLLHLDAKHERREEIRRRLKNLLPLTGKGKIGLEGGVVDVNRLHPTLLVLMGQDGHLAAYSSLEPGSVPAQ
ncbi:hypothetical protein ACHAXT_007184 [Thalassiosira profunda]